MPATVRARSGLPREEDERVAAAKPGVDRRGAWWVALTLFLFFEGAFVYRYGYQQAGLLHIDLPSFYLAATTTFDQGASPYLPSALRNQGPSVGQHVFPFLYPPPSLLPVWPLSFLTYPQAKVVTVVLNHLLVLAVIALLARLVRFRPPQLALLAGAFVVASDPVVQTVAHGQTNLAVLALLLLAWWGLRADTPTVAGVALGLAILVKPTPVILLGLLMARRAWRALAVAVGVLLIALVASLVVLPGGVWRDWLVNVRPTLGYGVQPMDLFSPACKFNQSLNGWVARIFLPGSCLPTVETVPWAGRLLTYGLAFAVLGSTMFVASRRRARAGLDLAFCAFLLAMFLVGALSWEHHLVFVLPAAMLLLQRRLDGGAGGTALLLAVLGATLPLPIYHGALDAGWLRLLVSARTYAVIALWTLTMAALLRERPSTEDASGDPALVESSSQRS